MGTTTAEASSKSPLVIRAQHTPGPWRVEEGTTLVWGACNEDDLSSYGMGYPVAEARVQLGHPSPLARSFRADEAEANARLIAAAPELYEALKVAEDAIRSYDGGDPTTETGWKNDELLQVWLTIDAALSKVEEA
jgi:hypothetical protein